MYRCCSINSAKIRLIRKLLCFIPIGFDVFHPFIATKNVPLVNRLLVRFENEISLHFLLSYNIFIRLDGGNESKRKRQNNFLDTNKSLPISFRLV